jgi:hypothetical protein
MRRDPVTSSAIASVGYDETTQTLEIEFVSGRVYRFLEVPPSLAQALRAAPSHGGFFNLFVRNGGYPYQHVAPEE